MRIWDYQLKPHKPGLTALNQSQRLDIAFASINHVRNRFSRIMYTGPGEAMKFFTSGFALIRSASDVSAIPSEAARILLDDARKWVPDAEQGIWESSMTIISILQRSGASLTEADLYEVLSYAYQVVLYDEILSKLERETIEFEIQKMEESNSSCMDCIATQIQLIADAKNGCKFSREL